MSCDQTVRNFRVFIEKSWSSVLSLGAGIDDFETFLDNWLQANWETLVEVIICQPGQYLLPYGNGADFGNSASRISFEHAKPTHKIVCSPIEGYLLDVLSDSKSKFAMDFDRFVSWTDNKYGAQPPLDYVMGTAGEKEYVVAIDSVKFSLASI